MEYLVTAGEMKQYDYNTIHHIKIPSMVLMERAALAAVEEIEKELEERKGKRALAVCGTGNNGGDGFAIGRILTDRGWHVDFLLAGSREQCSEDTAKQIKIIEGYGKKIFGIFPEEEYDIIIDAIFGIGLSRTVEGEKAKLIRKINASPAKVVAVDIPSGIHADSGQCLNVAVQADFTVTFEFQKRGLCMYPGKEYAGRVTVKDIGITERSFENRLPETFTYTEPVSTLLPPRSSGGNKGTFGKLLVIAGSPFMSGACQLCAKAAYRCGTGMVKIITAEENRVIIQETLPEALLGSWTPETPDKQWEKDLAWADGIVIGCGLGQSANVKQLVKLVLEKAAMPLILDADALNFLAADKKLQELLCKRCDEDGAYETILTPHQGELAALTGETISTLKKEAPLHASRLAQSWKVTVVSKDAATYVCGKNGELFLNTAGNSGMATAGSGDVLAGILGGLTVQGLKGFECACVGTYLHACAGDYAAGRSSEYALMAGDITEALPYLQNGKERT